MKDKFASLAHRELLDTPPYYQLIGPGLVWMALAQGSGELIWWPKLIAKYGLAFLFLLVPACLIQLPVTLEIARYTTLTGEGIFKGFFRLNRFFGVCLWLMFAVSFFWFGAFASAGGSAFAALVDFPRGWSHENQALFWAQVSIVVFTTALLGARRVYQLIEWVMKIVAIVSLVGMVIACAHPAVRSQIVPFMQGIVSPDWTAMQVFDPADASELLTAIAFAGLGGFWTLFYSYWVREKGIGMAGRSVERAKLGSGAQPIRRTEAALPAAEKSSAGRLRRWYRYLHIETTIGVLGNLATTLMMCLLAYALLLPHGVVPEGFNLVVEQARFFEASWGEFGRALFLIIAAAFLADTWLATTDCVSRIHIDALSSMFPTIAAQDQRHWYYGLVLLGAVITSITMYLDQPGPLIVTSALIGFAGTVVYSAALIVLNHVRLNAMLPVELRCSKASLIAIGFSTLCYFAIAVCYIAIQCRQWYE